TVGDVHLVVKWQLDRHRRQGVQHRTGARLSYPVAHVQVDEVVAMPTVNRQDNEDEEVSGERESLSGRHRFTSGFTSARGHAPRDMAAGCSALPTPTAQSLILLTGSAKVNEASALFA